MKKPLIGITPLVDTARESYWMLPGYMKGLEEAGSVTVMLPLVDEEASLEQLADLCDGFLFAGGHDVSPAVYGEATTGQCGECSSARIAWRRSCSILCFGGISLFSASAAGCNSSTPPWGVRSIKIYPRSAPRRSFIIRRRPTTDRRIWSRFWKVLPCTNFWERRFSL